MITLMSFGFKYRVPPANNYVDVSWVKNPARESRWGLFSQPNSEMTNFIKEQPMVITFIEQMVQLLVLLEQCDDDVRFAFGCSSGRHRSYIIVNLLKNELRKQGVDCKVVHMERDKHV